MPYAIKDLYSTRHAALIEVLKSTDFPTSGDWKSVVDNSRLLVTTEGYNADKYKVCETLRDRAASAMKKSGAKPAATLLTGAGVTSLPTSGNKSIPRGWSSGWPRSKR